MNILPNKLQLDVLRRHIGPFIFCFLTVMFLLLMQFLILHIDQLVGKGLPLGIIIELILTNLAYMVVLAAPMAVLVSTVMAYGRFSELNELTALNAAGVNPIRIITPVIFFSILLSIFLVWFSNNVLPQANQRARALFIDIRMKKPGFDLQPHVFYDGIEGYTFLVKRMSAEGDTLFNVTLFQEPGAKRDRAIIKADYGLLKSEKDRQTLTLYLHDGSILHYIPPQPKRREEVIEQTDFSKYRISFDLSELAFSRSNPNRQTRSDRTMSARAMLAVVDSLHHEIGEQREKYFDDAGKVLDPEEHLKNKTRYGPGYTGYTPPSDTTQLLPALKSRFTVLNVPDTWNEQRALIDRTLNKLRDLQARFDNLGVNIHWREQRASKFMVEVYKKYSIPFACLAFILIGAPIGMLTRKGNLGFAGLIGAGILTFYWISIIQGEKLADRMYISPFTGMWFGDILLSMIGIYLIIHMVTPYKISKLWGSRD